MSVVIFTSQPYLPADIINFILPIERAKLMFLNYILLLSPLSVERITLNIQLKV
jgi:hypothetical protein